MGEEEKKQVRESEGVDAPIQESPGIEAAPVAESKPLNNHIAEKRGRMIATGMVVGIGVSLIAVAVAAIFQVTSTWLIKCPADLSVNDPAPILWSDVVSDKAKQAPLGVPKELVKETSLKAIAAPAD